MIEEKRTGPDEAAFLADLLRPDYLAGESNGNWRLIANAWPTVIVWIAAARRDGAPDGFFMRLQCSGYPARGPTGAFWNTEKNAMLDHALWPKGRARVKHVFRTDWEGGLSLYHPFDGLALEKHLDWPQKYAEKLWSRSFTIGRWLAEFHELLNCDEYVGI